MLRRRILIFPLMLAASVSSVRADFTPPANGKLSEIQVTRFIAITKEQVEAMETAGSTDASAIRVSQAMDAAIARHEMTEDEFNWVGDKLAKLWPRALREKRWEDKTVPELQARIESADADLAMSQAQLALYTEAKRLGHRVLPGRHTTAVAALVKDRDALAAEVKTDREAIQPIRDEIALHEKDDSDAEALAQNPPPSIAPEDRTAYIDKRKNDAQAASDKAKEARDRLAEAQRNLADATARLEIAEDKVNHPDAPVTEAGKQQLVMENDTAISAEQQTIATASQTLADLKKQLAAGPPSDGDDQEQPDPDNLALATKHIGAYINALGASEKKP
jgi:hypothetical protein